MAPNEAREVVDLCDSSPETKKRKGADSSSSLTSAKRLLETGPEAIVQSAGMDTQQLQALLALATKLTTHAKAALANVRRQIGQCKCGKESSGNCDAKGCGSAVCDDCRFKCCGCEKTMCEVHMQYCCFDDDEAESSGKGCGKAVCKQCLETTKCDRDDVGECYDCLHYFECVDCKFCGEDY